MPVRGLHLGNLLSGIATWRQLIDRPDLACTFMVADVEAAVLGAPADTTTVRHTIRQLIAAGIDPSRCTIFVQGDVPAHLSAAYLLGTLFSARELGDSGYYAAIQSRDASSDRLTAAMLCYPLLQAADMLLYDATEVPAGADENEFLALAAEAVVRLARRGLRWTTPLRLVQGNGRMVMDLRDADRPMSKTSNSQGVIWVDDDADAVSKKFATAAHETHPRLQDALLGILELLGTPFRGGAHTTELAARCADGVNAVLEPIQARLVKLDDGEVETVRRSAAETARAVAGPRFEALAAATTRQGLSNLSNESGSAGR